MPHFPALLNSKGEGNSVPATLPLEMAKLSSRLGAVPARRFKVGLGSNRSIWLGPPFMNRWITLLARAGNCGAFGFRSYMCDAGSLARGARGAEQIGAQQRRQCGAVQPVHHARKEIAARSVCHWS